MDNVSKVLTLVAGLIITFLIIGIGFTIYNTSSDTADSAMSGITDLNNQLSESAVTKYDDTEISGSEVINVIKKFQNNKEKICITVVNGKSSTEYVYNSALSSVATNKLADAKDKGNLNKYINPNAMFMGTLIRDADTNTIIGLTFTIR